MIAVISIREQALRDELTSVLSAAGWTLHQGEDPEHALRQCKLHEADVVLVEEAFARGFLEQLNHGAERLHVGVVVVGEGLDVEEVVSTLRAGAADVLRTPVDPADAVARATAAARTKALVQQLVSHDYRMEDLVLNDELTGLRNRRAVLHDLQTLVATARRHEHALAAIMIDIDHFKAVNDTRGHRAGDAVLRGIARRISGRLRDADIAGRLGGDEFLLLLPETNAAGARTVAASILHAVGARGIDTPDGTIPITISLGSAAWDGEPAEMLLERADQALYAAKAAGRDRTAAV